MQKEFGMRNEMNEPDNNNQITTKAQENKAQESKSQDNKSQDNKSQENKAQENKAQENKSLDNKAQENTSQESNSQKNNFQESNSQVNNFQENNSQENKSQENNFQQNNSQANKSQENKSQENNSQENRYQENSSQEDRSQEKKSQESSSPDDMNEREDKKVKTEEELEKEKIKKENEDLKDQKISEYGQTVLEKGKKDHKIHLLSIIGEIEGHETLPQHNKTTKYEHVLPQLAAIEDSTEIDGLLILINTVGGDVEAGLAIAEMIASLSKPTVSLVLGGSHSIGVPLAVSANYSYIVPSATMIIHPVRMNGTVIGVTQTFEYFEKIQDRIINFVVTHSKIDYKSFKNLMLDTHQLAKDVGSILVGEETIKKGIIDEVGGIKEALNTINSMIDERKGEGK